MAKWKLVSRAMAERDDKGRLVIHRRGAEVELDEEQEQRLRAGQPGSAFQNLGDDEETELVEIAVANEATKSAEDGSLPVSPAGTRNMRVRATGPLPEAQPQPSDVARESGPAPAPTTTTAGVPPKQPRAGAPSKSTTPKGDGAS